MQQQHSPFRAEVVGSFLRPDSIKQARARFAAGEIDAGQLRLLENEDRKSVV